MPLPDLFHPDGVTSVLSRLHSLSPEATPAWGTMTAPQMLAHLNVAYEMVYTTKHPRPNPLMRFVLKRIVKQRVVGPDPYPKNTPTAPAFRIRNSPDFVAERERLTAFLWQVQQEGRAKFEGRESLSFGPLTADEWNGLFAKHLEHHFAQFGI